MSSLASLSMFKLTLVIALSSLSFVANAALFGDDDHSIWIWLNADNPASFYRDDCLNWRSAEP